MKNLDKVKNNLAFDLRESIEAKKKIIFDVNKIQKIITSITEKMKNNGKLLICGNGGSAADSQHIAAEFVGRFEMERGPLPAIALTTDSSVLTCIGNDYDYDQIFSRQVNGLGNKNDCLLCISTSGNSQNIFNAVKAANEKGITTIGLLGNNGGKIGDLCNHNLIVNSNNTARIQEAHIFIMHSICGLIDILKAYKI